MRVLLHGLMGVLFVVAWVCMANEQKSGVTTVGYRYAVVISKAAYAENGWKMVADSLLRKHAKTGTSRLIIWKSSVQESIEELGVFKPDYIGFIARPVVECNVVFVVSVSKLCRQIDCDPYGDAVWGIITGYEAADALRAISESLEVKTVLSASGNLSYEPPLNRFYQAIGMTCDSYSKTDYLFTHGAGKVYTENQRPGDESDRIKIVASLLKKSDIAVDIPNEGTISGPVDCIITGGHGNGNSWQCHYPDVGNEGFMLSSGGTLYGVPFSGNPFALTVQTPKIYWCASNCLMGNPDSSDNIVYAAFHTGHALQLFGFINNASAGNEFMAWGTFDRVTKCAGKITLPLGFFISNNNAQFELEHPSGLMNTERIKMFMDSTVFYGDPAGDVTFYDVSERMQAYTSKISYVKGFSDTAMFTYTYTMNTHDLEYGTGYCYQFRPVEMLPVRIDPATVVVIANEGYTPVITDNLLLWKMLSKGDKLKKGTSRTLRWSAVLTDEKTEVFRKVNAQRSPSVKVCTIRYQGSYQRVVVDNVEAGKLSYQIFDVSGRMCGYGVVDAVNSSPVNIRLQRALVAGVYCVTVAQQHSVVHRYFIVGG